ncbi:MAG: hypothetical protein NC299_06560 [Lachnospiraceae bacterium]|nr:hypothetical protein [Ruminococcus sp.]MCM1275016.1 hypothetical protein [Lachnospiraceae bacterium]
MSDDKNRHIGYTVSLCGIMCGLALALMFILGMIPSFEYVTPAVAGILIWVIRDRLGVKYGLVSYIAVGLLCLLITPNYEVAMMYIFLLGYYPIVREYLQRIRLKILRWAAKLALFSVTAVGAYTVLIYLFGMTYLLDDANDFGKYGTLILYGMGAFAFVMYDIFLGMYAPFYEKILKPKIMRRMK